MGTSWVTWMRVCDAEKCEMLTMCPVISEDVHRKADIVCKSLMLQTKGSYFKSGNAEAPRESQGWQMQEKINGTGVPSLKHAGYHIKNENF